MGNYGKLWETMGNYGKLGKLWETRETMVLGNMHTLRGYQ